MESLTTARITKTATGTVIVTYSGGHMDEEDNLTLKYAIESFSYLVQRNQQLCFADFAAMIRRHYVAEGRVKLCIESLEKASMIG